MAGHAAYAQPGYISGSLDALEPRQAAAALLASQGAVRSELHVDEDGVGRWSARYGCMEEVGRGLRGEDRAFPPFVDARWNGGLRGSSAGVDFVDASAGERPHACARGGDAWGGAVSSSGTPRGDVEYEEEEGGGEEPAVADAGGSPGIKIPLSQALRALAQTLLSAVICGRIFLRDPAPDAHGEVMHPQYWPVAPLPGISSPLFSSECAQAVALLTLSLAGRPRECRDVWRRLRVGSEPLGHVLQASRLAWPLDPAPYTHALAALSVGVEAAAAAVEYFLECTPTLTLAMGAAVPLTRHAAAQGGSLGHFADPTQRQNAEVFADQMRELGHSRSAALKEYFEESGKVLLLKRSLHLRPSSECFSPIATCDFSAEFGFVLPVSETLAAERRALVLKLACGEPAVMARLPGALQGRSSFMLWAWQAAEGGGGGGGRAEGRDACRPPATRPRAVLLHTLSRLASTFSALLTNSEGAGLIHALHCHLDSLHAIGAFLPHLLRHNPKEEGSAPPPPAAAGADAGAAAPPLLPLPALDPHPESPATISRLLALVLVPLLQLAAPDKSSGLLPFAALPSAALAHAAATRAAQSFVPGAPPPQQHELYWGTLYGPFGSRYALFLAIHTALSTLLGLLALLAESFPSSTLPTLLSPAPGTDGAPFLTFLTQNAVQVIEWRGGGLAFSPGPGPLTLTLLRLHRACVRAVLARRCGAPAPLLASLSMDLARWSSSAATPPSAGAAASHAAHTPPPFAAAVSRRHALALLDFMPTLFHRLAHAHLPPGTPAHTQGLSSEALHALSELYSARVECHAQGSGRQLEYSHEGVALGVWGAAPAQHCEEFLALVAAECAEACSSSSGAGSFYALPPARRALRLELAGLAGHSPAQLAAEEASLTHTIGFVCNLLSACAPPGDLYAGGGGTPECGEGFAPRLLTQSRCASILRCLLSFPTCSTASAGGGAAAAAAAAAAAPPLDTQLALALLQCSSSTGGTLGAVHSAVSGSHAATALMRTALQLPYLTLAAHSTCSREDLTAHPCCAKPCTITGYVRDSVLHVVSVVQGNVGSTGAGAGVGMGIDSLSTATLSTRLYEVVWTVSADGHTREAKLRSSWALAETLGNGQYRVTEGPSAAGDRHQTRTFSLGNATWFPRAGGGAQWWLLAGMR